MTQIWLPLTASFDPVEYALTEGLDESCVRDLVEAGAAGGRHAQLRYLFAKGHLTKKKRGGVHYRKYRRGSPEHSKHASRKARQRYGHAYRFGSPEHHEHLRRISPFVHRTESAIEERGITYYGVTAPSTDEVDLTYHTTSGNLKSLVSNGAFRRLVRMYFMKAGSNKERATVVLMALLVDLVKGLGIQARPHILDNIKWAIETELENLYHMELGADTELPASMATRGSANLRMRLFKTAFSRFRDHSEAAEELVEIAKALLHALRVDSPANMRNVHKAVNDILSSAHFEGHIGEDVRGEQEQAVFEVACEALAPYADANLTLENVADILDSAGLLFRNADAFRLLLDRIVESGKDSDRDDGPGDDDDDDHDDDRDDSDLGPGDDDDSDDEDEEDEEGDDEDDEEDDDEDDEDDDEDDEEDDDEDDGEDEEDDEEDSEDEKEESYSSRELEVYALAESVLEERSIAKALGHAAKGVLHAGVAGLGLYGGISATHAFSQPHSEHPEAVRWYQARAKQAIDAAHLKHAKRSKEFSTPSDTDWANKAAARAQHLPGGDVANVGLALGRAKFHDIVARSKGHAAAAIVGSHALALHQGMKAAKSFRTALKHLKSEDKSDVSEDRKEAVKHALKGLGHAALATGGAFLGTHAYAGHSDAMKQKKAEEWAKHGWEHGVPERGIPPKTAAPEHGIGPEGKPMRAKEIGQPWHGLGRHPVPAHAVAAGGYGLFFHQGSKAVQAFKKAYRAARQTEAQVDEERQIGKGLYHVGAGVASLGAGAFGIHLRTKGSGILKRGDERLAKMPPEKRLAHLNVLHYSQGPWAKEQRKREVNAITAQIGGTGLAVSGAGLAAHHFIQAHKAFKDKPPEKPKKAEPAHGIDKH